MKMLTGKRGVVKTVGLLAVVGLLAAFLGGCGGGGGDTLGAEVGTRTVGAGSTAVGAPAIASKLDGQVQTVTELVAVTPNAAGSTAKGGVLNLGPIQPSNPGWGQTAMFNVYVWRNGPVANARVEAWFSGRHGMQATHYATSTNREGRATFSMRLPSDWRYYDTWADFNASCPTIGVAQLWRAKNK